MGVHFLCKKGLQMKKCQLSVRTYIEITAPTSQISFTSPGVETKHENQRDRNEDVQEERLLFCSDTDVTIPLLFHLIF
ncbi:unnamed protein product [Ixodes pacificus]